MKQILNQAFPIKQRAGDGLPKLGTTRAIRDDWQARYTLALRQKQGNLVNSWEDARVFNHK